MSDLLQTTSWNDRSFNRSIDERLRCGVNMSGRRVVVGVLDVGGGEVVCGVDGGVCVRSHGVIVQTTLCYGSGRTELGRKLKVAIRGS